MFAPLPPRGVIRDLANDVTLAPAAIGAAVTARAALLRGYEVGPGDVVAITHGGTADFFLDLFSVWRVGAAAACFDPSLSDDERQRLTTFCNAKVALRAGEGAESLAGRPLLALASMAGAAEGTPFGDAPTGGSLDAPALILFTSGTTGAPKGVVLSQRALLARVALNRAAIGDAILARTLVTLPTHFGHGLIGNALTPLMSGATIVLHPPGLGLSQRLGEIIDREEITFLSSVPSFWRLALKVGRPPVSGTLRRVHVGSAPLSSELWRDIAAWTGAETVNCYGITETANWIGGASSVHDGVEDGLVGAPWGGAYALLRDDGVISTAGEGEVLAQTPALMTGYLHRPDLTEAAMLGGWYRTGDRGEMDANGRLRLTGRLKDEINRAGMKVQPAELDMLLERHPAVAEACAFGVADEVSGEIVAIALRLKPGEAVSESALRDWVGERLRRHAIPERWFFVADIPRTSRGKVSRDLVRATVMGGE